MVGVVSLVKLSLLDECVCVYLGAAPHTPTDEGLPSGPLHQLTAHAAVYVCVCVCVWLAACHRFTPWRLLPANYWWDMVMGG